jgi:hypothetical protein
MGAEGVEQTEWITSRDSHVRPEHEELDGEVRPLGQSFTLGAVLRYPLDAECGDVSLVANCRCTSAPVV